jgi:hypothetical protein
MTRGQRLYFPPKDGLLWIFITLKNPSPLAGSEPANPRSNGKHANHYCTEDNYNNSNYTIRNPTLCQTNMILKNYLAVSSTVHVTTQQDKKKKIFT